MMDATELAKRLTKARKMGDSWWACCPAHDDQDPSLKIDECRDGTVLVKCWAGCQQGAVIDALRSLGLWSTSRHPSTNINMYSNSSSTPTLPTSDTARTAGAMAIWQEAGKLDGSPGMSWLFRRGVNLGALPRDLHRALRWHPACPWENGRHGCIVGLFTHAVTGEPNAIHRTAITAAGEKVGRKALGPIAGCVIRLWPDEDVLDGLVIGEGIETTFAASTCIEHKGTLLQPAWAAGFAGSMAKLPVLSGIEALTLIVDNDASGAGQRAAEECSARWTAAGCEVHRLVPRQVGADFNDIIEVPHE